MIQCISCGKCLSVCPLFLSTLREDLGPRGKWLLLNQALNSNSKALEELASLCLGCGRCSRVCTQSLNFAQSLSELKQKHQGLAETTYKTLLHLIQKPGVIRILPLLESILKNKKIFITPKISYLRLLPLKKLSFKRPVVIFPGCLGPYFPLLEENLKKILLALGNKVISLRWQCCGLPYLLAGFKTQANKLKQHNHQLWLKANKPIVITFCATCYQGLKDWLTVGQDLLLAEDLLENFSIQKSTNFIAHYSCHTHTFFGNYLPPSQIVDACCGLGGSLRLKEKKLTQKVATYFWQQVKEEYPVFTNCLGCLMQLRLTSSKNKIAHWLETITIEE